MCIKDCKNEENSDYYFGQAMCKRKKFVIGWTSIMLFIVAMALMLIRENNSEKIKFLNE